MWKYIVVYWVVIIGTDKIAKTKNTQEFNTRREATAFMEFSKKQGVFIIEGLKLDSLKIKL